MTAPIIHRLQFRLPILPEHQGTGYITLPQERENVNWRCGLLSVENNNFGFQMMCNQEDRSNFWFMKVAFEFSVGNKPLNESPIKQKGTFTFRARKYLTLRMPMEAVTKVVVKKEGFIARFVLTILDMEGIPKKRIHDFSTLQRPLHNLTLIVKGRPIHCNKQIVAMNSEFFLNLLFLEADGKEVDKLELPGDYEYDKILRLIKLFYNDSDALTAENVDETLQLATNFKSENARTRCERWISRTPTMSPQKKMSLAEKYALVELQNDCVKMLKTSAQLQKFFDSPDNLHESEISDLLNKVTLSIVGSSTFPPK